MTTMNLVQLQQSLQTLPMQNVIQYANGSDPTVPAYMALTELNRRKMLQDNATAASNVPSQTVKQNLENAITKPNQLAVNPAQSSQLNPAQAPAQVDPTVLQGQVNPVAAQAPPNPFKHGGLASYPVNMFKQKNFAPGGIVAFSEGQSVALPGVQAAKASAMSNPVAQASLANMLRQKYNMDYNNDPSNPVNPSSLSSQFDSTNAFNSMNSYSHGGLLSLNPVVRFDAGTGPDTVQGAANQQLNGQDATGGFNTLQSGNGPTQIPLYNPNAQVSNTPSGNISGTPAQLNQLSPQQQQAVGNFYNFPPSYQLPQEKTARDIYFENQKLNELAGVSSDPYAESKKRYEAIEAKQKSNESNDAMDRLIAQASAFATADPTKGFGYQMAMGANVSQALKDKQDALRESQALSMAKLYTEYDKEDDARKRGDVAAVQKSLADQQKHHDDILTLQNQFINAQAAKQNAESNARNADSNAFVSSYKPYEVANQTTQANAAMVGANAQAANANKLPTEIQMAQRYATDPAFAKAYDAMKTVAQEGTKEQRARDDWNKSIKLQMDYPNIKDYLVSQGIKGASASPTAKNYPATWTNRETGAVYTLQPNGNYVMTTAGK